MRIKAGPARYILYGQLWFICSLVLCIILMPKGLAANDGFSYYGAHIRTVVPYSLGLIAIAWLYLQAARSLPNTQPLKTLKYGIYSFIFLLVVGIVTPFKLSPSFHWVHVAATITIFVIEMIIALWLVVVLRWDIVNVLLISLLAVEILIAALFVQPVNGFLIQAEVAFQLTFAALMIRTLSFLPEKVNLR